MCNITAGGSVLPQDIKDLLHMISGVQKLLALCWMANPTTTAKDERLFVNFHDGDFLIDLDNNATLISSWDDYNETWRKRFFCSPIEFDWWAFNIADENHLQYLREVIEVLNTQIYEIFPFTSHNVYDTLRSFHTLLEQLNGKLNYS